MFITRKRDLSGGAARNFLVQNFRKLLLDYRLILLVFHVPLHYEIASPCVAACNHLKNHALVRGTTFALKYISQGRGSDQDMMEEIVIRQTSLLIVSFTTAFLIPAAHWPVLSFLRRWQRLIARCRSRKSSCPRRKFCEIDFTDFEP
jgi:hypothetical protein